MGDLVMIVKNFKESREEIDLKQSDIADMFGVHFSTVSGWETGKDTIPIMKLTKYASEYHYSLDYLFGIINRNIRYASFDVDRGMIARNLRRLRIKYGYSQVDLAKMLNTTQSTISYWENGISMISTSFIIGLIDIYKDMSIDKLFGRRRL